MKHSTFFSAIVFMTTFPIYSLGHMALSYPAPFRSSLNPFAVKAIPGKIDYSMTSPLDASGDNFPCKGYQVDMADTTGAGASVATWTQGGAYNFSVTGGATHGGGSCQASLSYDGGKSFKVIHSYIGSCPLSDGQKFDFDIPSDAATGAAMFAWTWYNEIGNREIYMNCASVTIASGTGSAPAVAFSARPDIFVANLDNGCTTVETKDVVFPDPGPSADVTQLKNDAGSFTGTCAAVGGIGGGSASSGSSGSSANSAPSAGSQSAPSTATTSIMSIQIIPSSVATSSSYAQASGFSIVAGSATPAIGSSTYSASSAGSTGSTGTSSGLTISVDGQCSGSQTCTGSEFGSCCSQWGYCGNTPLHCGAGCMADFGQCGTFVNSTSTAAPSVAVKFRS